MNDRPIKKTEKKSETIEVRVSYTEKLAFMEACKQAGTTASHAIREYIGDFLSPPDKQPRTKQTFVVIILFCALIGASIAMISYPQNDTVPLIGERVMRYFDRNNDGFITIADTGGSNAADTQTINWLIQTADQNNDSQVNSDEITALTNVTIELRGNHTGENKDAARGESIVIVPPDLSAEEREVLLEQTGLQQHLKPEDRARLMALIDALAAGGKTASDKNTHQPAENN